MQPWENVKNPNLGPNLGPPKFSSWVLPLLVFRQCFKLSSYKISWKTNEPNMKKMTRILIWGPILAHLPQIWAPQFFLFFYLFIFFFLGGGFTSNSTDTLFQAIIQSILKKI